MVITCQDRNVLATEIKPLVEAFFQERGLSLSEEKSRITHIDEGFDFLGQHIRKYKGHLLTKPSQKSQQTLLGKVRTILKQEGRYLSAYGLIQRLNPIIRGWANYHRHVASKRVFVRIDHQIHMALWRWAKRRHPKKSVGWILKKYFEDTASQRNGIPYTRWSTTTGQKVAVRLIKAADTPIQRYIKVRKDANPYDPAWEVYFEQRLYLQVGDDLWDRPRLRHQWRMQQGRCPVCGELITQETGWHNHHIHWRVYGGSEELENRVLLHPHCHRQVHSPRISTVRRCVHLSWAFEMLEPLTVKVVWAVLRGRGASNGPKLPGAVEKVPIEATSSAAYPTLRRVPEPSWLWFVNSWPLMPKSASAHLPTNRLHLSTMR